MIPYSRPKRSDLYTLYQSKLRENQYPPPPTPASVKVPPLALFGVAFKTCAEIITLLISIIASTNVQQVFGLLLTYFLHSLTDIFESPFKKEQDDLGRAWGDKI